MVYADPKPAYACSCQQPKSVIESLEELDAVFSGKVIGLESFDFETVVVFDVDTSWKGITSEPAKVHTETGDASCGYPFEENNSYLVYAGSRPDGVLGTSYCTRTALLDTAEADLIALGRGDVSFGQAEAAYEPTFRIEHPILLVAIVGFTAAAIAVVVIARKKS